MKNLRANRSGAMVVAAGAAAGLWSGGAAGAGLVTATWLNPVSGTWNVATNWSTNPNFPNNGTPSGETYHAVIDAAGSAYTVTVTSNVTVDQLTLNSADAQVHLSTGVVRAVNGIDLGAGQFRLFGGSVVDTRITSTGGLLTKGAGTTTLNNVELDTDFRLDNGSVTAVSNGLQLELGRTLRMNAANSATYLQTTDGSTIGGGEIILDGTTGNNLNRLRAMGGHDLVIGPDLTIRTGTGGGIIGEPQTGLVNQGTISAETAGQTITVTGTNWRNEGLLRVSAGVMRLEGSVAVGGLGDISVTGGNLDVYGTINNAGNTILLDGADKNLRLVSFTSKLIGGTVQTGNGGQFRIFGTGNSAPLLDGVTLDADVNVASGHDLRAQNGLTIAAGRTLSLLGGVNSGTVSELRLEGGSQTLGGGGELVFNGQSATADRNSVTTSGMTVGSTLTVGPDFTVRTGTGGGVFGSLDRALVNQGTMIAGAGQSLIVQGQNWRNEGTLRVEQGGYLELRGSMVGGFGNIEMLGSWLNLGGSFDHTGQVTTLSPDTFKVRLRDNSNFFGGTVYVDDSGGGERIGTSSTSIIVLTKDDGRIGGDKKIVGTSDTGFRAGVDERGLSNIVIDPEAAVAITGTGGSRLTVEGGLTLGDATIFVAPQGGSQSGLRFVGTQSLLAAPGVPVIRGADPGEARGTVLFGGNVSSQQMVVEGGALTIGEGIAILTENTSLNVSIGAGGSIVNHGVISARESGRFIDLGNGTLAATSFVNAEGGVLEVASGATLQFNGAGVSWENNGLIRMLGGTLNLGGNFTTNGIGQLERTGGTVNIRGVLDNSGEALTLDAATGSWRLDGGTIRGGSLNFADGARLVLSTPNGTLENVQVNGELLINANGGVRLTGSTRFEQIRATALAQIRLNGGYTLLDPILYQTGSSGDISSGTTNGVITIGESGSIVVTGGSPFFGSGMAALNHQGLIDIAASGTFDIRPLAFNNTASGHVRAQTGTVRFDAFSGGMNLTQNGLMEARSGGVIRFMTDQVMTNGGELLAGVNGRFEMTNGFAQSASGLTTIEIGGLSTSQFGRLVVTGNAALDGGLAVTLAGGFTPQWGDQWTILTAGSIAGDFASFDFAPLSGGLAWWAEATSATTYAVGIRASADINNDGVINFGDLNIVLSGYNMPGTVGQGDLNGDGFIDFADLNVVLSSFNQVKPGLVPAPGGVALLAVVGLVGGRRRRGR